MEAQGINGGNLPSKPLRLAGLVVDVSGISDVE
jgi:hypothetical protein